MPGDQSDKPVKTKARQMGSRRRDEMAEPISLKPLAPEQALEGLLATPPPPKPERASRRGKKDQAKDQG